MAARLDMAAFVSYFRAGDRFDKACEKDSYECAVFDIFDVFDACDLNPHCEYMNTHTSASLTHTYLLYVHTHIRSMYTHTHLLYAHTHTSTLCTHTIISWWKNLVTSSPMSLPCVVYT